MTEVESRNLSIPECFDRLFDSFRLLLNFNMPCYVLKYYEENNRPYMVDVQPIFSDFYKNDEGEIIEVKPAPIVNVPVQFPMFGDFYIKGKIKPGDLGTIKPMDRSLDKYLETDGKEIIDPGLYNVNDWSDCIFEPGLSTVKNKPDFNSNPDNLIIGMKNGDAELHINPTTKELQFKGDAVRLGSLTGNKALALATETNTRFNSIEQWALQVTAFLAALGFASPAPSGSSVASGKVFTNG